MIIEGKQARESVVEELLETQKLVVSEHEEGFKKALRQVALLYNIDVDANEDDAKDVEEVVGIKGTPSSLSSSPKPIAIAEEVIAGEVLNADVGIELSQIFVNELPFVISYDGVSNPISTHYVFPHKFVHLISRDGC
ncbi:hypothetical protein V8G54_027013 [Vigna mungo]|uniref:Uncharacterized protein n=1 Tax=Vigna mungo TaxID=3915 RepID=A0AAQ3N135_VIGMU